MAVKLVAMITKKEKDRIVVDSIAFQSCDQLADFLIGKQEAIIMVGDFFPHFWNVGIVGWN